MFISRFQSADSAVRLAQRERTAGQAVRAVSVARAAVRISQMKGALPIGARAREGLGSRIQPLPGRRHCKAIVANRKHAHRKAMRAETP
jgi:hypothetical protein